MIQGFDQVLAKPAMFVNFPQREKGLTDLVQDVAKAALELEKNGGKPLEMPGILAALQLEDAGVIQRRIEVLESVPESTVADELQPYRRLMIAALRAKAKYVLNLH